MKHLEISEEEHANHECNIEWWQYVRQRWIDAGFDTNKPVTQYLSNDTRHIVFTQED